MKHKLENLNGGWRLLLPAEERKRCSRCECKVTHYFYFCPDTKLMFCDSCEEQEVRVCTHIITAKKPEHTHFNIIDTKEL